MKTSWAVALACLVTCFAVAHILAQPASGNIRPGLPDRLPLPGYNRPPPGAPFPAPYTVTNTHSSSVKTNELTFENLSTNQTFYFISDIKRKYPWVKIGATVCQNTVNSNQATILPSTPVKQ
jgi:hypothetical protein